MSQTQQLEQRELVMRAELAEDGKTVVGVGVPYGETITVWGERERFEPGSVDAEGALLFYRHNEPIGVVLSSDDKDTGWHPTARFSDTQLARDARALARDGALPGMSIGFQPIEWRMESDDDGEVIVYEKARIREVSLVPFPAYPSAQVAHVRHEQETPSMSTTTTEPSALDKIREQLDEQRDDMTDLQRAIAAFTDRAGHDRTEVADDRSAGQILRGLARGDSDIVRDYESLVTRAYEDGTDGGTSADGILTPQWVGDTIRLVERPNVLGQVFSTGTLPARGLTLEYGELLTNSISVEEQVNEGDDLTVGNIVVTSKTAPIKTFGGATHLTRQQIERTTNVNKLDLHLRGLAMAAGARRAIELNTLYEATVAAQSAAGGSAIVVADQTDYVEWVGGIIDAADAYEAIGLALDALVVDKETFKGMAGLNDSSGRPLMKVYGSGENIVGEVSATSITGNLGGVRVVVNPRHTEPTAAFVNAAAIRQYASSVTELADENIINLSKSFGLYYYAANAAEIPGAIMPVVATEPV